MREIILDTETTGLDPNDGDRIVEIGCVELINHMTRGETFQRYVNPERDIPSQALAVHGLTEEFLAQHPVFAEIVVKIGERKIPEIIKSTADCFNFPISINVDFYFVVRSKTR